MAPTRGSKELVDWLEHFYRLVKTGMKPNEYDYWVSTVRPDIEAIADPQVRALATALLLHVQGGYVQKAPEKLETVVLPAIRNLIEYPRSAFHLAP